MSEAPIINRSLYADWQNSSFLPAKGRVGGDEVWSTDGELQGQRIPVALGLHDGDLIVSYGNVLAALDPNDGRVLWTKQIRGNNVFAMDESGILTLNDAGNYEPIAFDGHAEQDIYLSSVSIDTYLHFLVQDGELFRFVYEQYPEPYSTPEDKPPPPVSRFVSYRPRDMHVIWQYTLPPRLVGVVLTRDRKRMYIADARRMATFPADATTDDAVTWVDFTQIASLSTDPDGNALLVDIVEDSTELRQIKPDGTDGWTVSFDKTDVSPQPAASSPDGFVYVVIDSAVHQIKNGELQWSHKLTAKTQDIRITVLADNSVLAAAGQALVQISAEGEEITAKWLETPIGTRPIMDENGRVYFGGRDGIHCLR